jgi:hypothetical protein
VDCQEELDGEILESLVIAFWIQHLGQRSKGGIRLGTGIDGLVGMLRSSLYQVQIHDFSHLTSAFPHSLR